MSTQIQDGEKLTVPELGRRWRISVGKIRNWIKTGQLAAVDVSGQIGSRRPNYRIDQRDIEAFERQRAVAAKGATS